MGPVGEDPFEGLRKRLSRLRRRRARLPLQQAAVLVPLYVRDGELVTVLTRRSEELSKHKGQVSFPGGRLDPGEDARDAALREAEEELGIPPEVVEPLGALHDTVVITGFRVTPFVARIPPGLELHPNPREVARAFTAPLPALADPARTPFRLEPKRFGGRLFQVPYFEWDGELIWGATGRILLDLLELMELK